MPKQGNLPHLLSQGMISAVFEVNLLAKGNTKQQP